MLRILNAIIGGGGGGIVISEILIEFMKLKFTETCPKLGKIRLSCWIMYSTDRFWEGAKFG